MIIKAIEVVSVAFLFVMPYNEREQNRVFWKGRFWWMKNQIKQLQNQI